MSKEIKKPTFATDVVKETALDVFAEGFDGDRGKAQSEYDLLERDRFSTDRTTRMAAVGKLAALRNEAFIVLANQVETAWG